jgi:hypothetical protein
VVTVNTDQGHMDATLEAVAREAASSREAEVVDQQVEVL